MFEFGKDLRKLFAQARESDDLGWLELIGVDLVEAEARAQSTDAGRVSCQRPVEAELRASALWREHARRTGRRSSLSKAAEAARRAGRLAKSEDHAARSAVELARVLILEFDLFGGTDRLVEAEDVLDASAGLKRARPGVAAAAVHARLRARTVRLTGGVAEQLDAAALMDAALHDLPDGDPEKPELQMDRAALALEAGVIQRDPRLLDQAGRDLGLLVAAASPDYRPLTRARALALCGAGLSALAAMAGDADAAAQGRLMFEAAADQFTPDHSPMDWAVIQLLRAEAEPAIERVAQAEALVAETNLLLSAQLRERRVALEVQALARTGDVTGLGEVAGRLRRRVAEVDAQAAPLDWAADQIGLAHVAIARSGLLGGVFPDVGMILAEAALTAREQGALALAARADAMLPEKAEA